MRANLTSVCVSHPWARSGSQALRKSDTTGNLSDLGYGRHFFKNTDLREETHKRGLIKTELLLFTEQCYKNDKTSRVGRTYLQVVVSEELCLQWVNGFYT